MTVVLPLPPRNIDFLAFGEESNRIQFTYAKCALDVDTLKPNPIHMHPMCIEV